MATCRRIRAAVLRDSRRPLEIESLRIEGPRPDEVLVRIVASGICHTDIGFRDSWSVEDDPPVILGHEGAGIVEEVGRKVKTVRPGDHVVLSYQSCGRCGPCRSSRPADCRNLYDLNFGFRRLDGSSAYRDSGVEGHFFGQSSFATLALATERNLVKVSRKLDLERLAPLGCGLQTGAGTIFNSLKVRAGKSVAVFGTGTVGLAAIMAAKINRADPIIGIDIRPGRLDMARELGATHVVDGRRGSIPRQIAAITGRGVDYAVETAGRLETAIEVLNPNGVAGFLTGESGPKNLPDGKRVLSIIQGDAVPQRFIPRLIRLSRAGRFPYERLIRLYDFSEINRAISDSKRGVTIKPVLRIGSSEESIRSQ